MTFICHSDSATLISSTVASLLLLKSLLLISRAKHHQWRRRRRRRRRPLAFSGRRNCRGNTQEFVAFYGLCMFAYCQASVCTTIHKSRSSTRSSPPSAAPTRSAIPQFTNPFSIRYTCEHNRSVGPLQFMSAPYLVVLPPCPCLCF